MNVLANIRKRSLTLRARDVAAYVQGRPIALAPLALGGGVSVALDAPPVEAPVADRVAFVPILGPLLQRAERGLCGGFVDGYDAIAARFQAAIGGEDVGAIVLVIDSPGGDGAGLAEAVRRMRAMADDAGTPVLAYVDELAASAAYWIAAGVADQVFVPETGRVGSIGAIAVHVDASAAAEKEGLKYTLIRKPSGKAAGSGYEPLGGVGRARIERDVEALSAQFIAAMADRRGVAASKLKALDADVVQGTAAVKAGLADAVATLEDVAGRASAAARARTSNRSANASGRYARTSGGPPQKDSTMTKKREKRAAKAAALGMTIEAYNDFRARRKAEKKSRLAAELFEAGRACEREFSAAASGALTPEERLFAEKWNLDPGDLEATKARIHDGVLQLGALPLRAKQEAEPTSSTPAGDAVGLTPEEYQVARLLQLEPKAVAATKARELAR